MPIRIYALAKELKIDSKELVNICTKAGITGKGSALASLSDEEEAKVRTFLAGPKKQPAPPVREAAPPEAPKPPAPTPEPPKAPAPMATTPVTPTTRPTIPAPIRREDYVPPAGSNKIRVIEQRKPGGPETTGRKDREPDKDLKKRREPAIHLAKMPEVKQPTAPPKAEEPKPQKPDIRLPQDAITGHKKGKRAPLDLAKLEKKWEARTADDKDKDKDKEKEKPKREKEARTDDAPLKTAARRRPATKQEEEEAQAGRRLAGLAGARQERQKARRTRARSRTDSATEPTSEEPTRGRRRRTLTRRGTNTAAPRKGRVALELPCTVRSFSEATGVPAGKVIMTLMNLGQHVTINQQIEEEYVELLAAELGVEVEFKQPESLEDKLLQTIEQQPDEEEQLEPRPPVVTFLGHVDHGKTSLLDSIIGINVVAGEAGGITQHIRAYQIDKDGRKISFVDTPGHEAFTEMRARGANVTDVAVLVIAADDGVMPQTEEAISHAKAAGVPIVVALNKIDLPGVNENRILQQLTQYQLMPSEWGGEVEVVRTSAITGQGIDTLLDTILTIAELHEYRANPSRRAYGACLEAQQESGRGVMAKFMVRNGTLRVGDVVVCGGAHGRIKAMYDPLRLNERVEQVGPATPVNVIGLDSPPDAGDKFYVLDDIAVARELAEQRQAQTRQAGLLGHTTRVSFEEFQRRLSEGRLSETQDVVMLNLIIRADVRGSLEAIEKELGKLYHPEVQIRILHKAVGAVSVADVTLAHASHAVIIGFNVTTDEAARALADDRGVEIRRYDIIYQVTEDIKALLEGKLKPEQRVVELGQAVVKQVFPISRVGTVAGCYVIRGTIERGCRIRVNRDGRTIGDYPIDSLRREKEDVREVPRGMECGIKLAGFNDVKRDDVLEAYKIEEVARTL